MFSHSRPSNFAYTRQHMCLLYEAEDSPYLFAIPMLLIGLEPVYFCTKTLWDGLIYHLGFHPRTFRPGEVFVSLLLTLQSALHLRCSSSYVITDIPIIHL